MNADGPLNRKFDQIATEALKKFHIAGLSIAVVDDGQTWAKVR
jgi:CubicO group peptidase (beta-lactamase class C family)